MSGVVLFLIAFSLAVVNKKKMLNYLPMTALALGMLTYFLGITIGLQALVGVKVFLLINCLFIIVKNYKAIEIKKIFGAETILFCIYFFSMMLINSTRTITDWDDMGHWGTMVKQIFFDQVIPTGSTSISDYSDYPPFGACYINFFLKDFSDYHEFLVFPIWNSILIVLFTPFWERINVKKGVLNTLCYLFVIIFLQRICTITSEMNLKADVLVSCLFLYICIKCLKEEMSIVDFYLAITVMILSKTVGIFFAVVAILIRFIVRNKSISLNKEAIALMFPLVTFFSWKLFCILGDNSSYINEAYAKIPIVGYFKSGIYLIEFMPLTCTFPILISITGILILYLGNSKKATVIWAILSSLVLVVSSIVNRFLIFRGVDYSDIENIIERTARHYWEAISTWGIGNVYGIDDFGLSILELITISIILMTLLLKFDTKSEVNKYKRFLTIWMLTFTIYVIGHSAMYFYLFTGPEQEILSAFTRYLSMHTAAIFGVTIFFIIDKIDVMPNYKLSLLVVMMLIVGFGYNYNVWTATYLHNNDTYNEEKDRGNKFRNKATVLRECIKKDNYNYCIIGGDDYLFCRNAFGYYLAPARNLISINATDVNQDEFKQTIQDANVNYAIVDNTTMDNSLMEHITNVLVENDYTVVQSDEEIILFAH